MSDPRALLELYLLSDLDEAEARRVEAWLEEHPEAEAELDAARGTVDALDAELTRPEGAEALADRIVAAAEARQPTQARRPVRWWRAAAALAAVAALALAVRALVRGRDGDEYPPPRAAGSYTVAGGGEVRRGATLEAGDEGATLDLGGYCRLAFDPDSVARLAGEPRAERIVLERGVVLCDVDHDRGRFAVETDLCTAEVHGTRFLVQLDAGGTGGPPMGPKQVLVRVLAGIVLVSGAWGHDVVLAGEATKVPPPPPAQVAEKQEPKPEDLAKALAGFKGFLAGQLLEADDGGIVLRVEAVTLLRDCKAPNPGILLGRDTPIRFAAEADAAGNPRPAPDLVRTAKRLRDMPGIAFGMPGGGDAIMIMDVGEPGQQGAVQFLGQGARVTARRMTLRMNGDRIEIGGEPPDELAPEKPQGPLTTVRVQADPEGILVVDRLMPGGQAPPRWEAMPQFRLAEAPRPGLPLIGNAPPPPPEPAPFEAAMEAFAEQRAKMQAQAEVLEQRLDKLQELIERREPMPDAQRARLLAQRDQLLAQRDAQRKHLAQLEQALAQQREMVERHRRRRVRPERARPEPRDTDF